MGEDQAATLEALRQLRRDLFEPVVATNAGTVIKRLGDGWIVEFPSITDAVTCALAVQDGLAEHDRIKLRIGVHIGEVAFEDEDVFGDGVNVAARLEALAEPGEVLISDTAHHSLDGQVAKLFSGGEVLQLKNIARPVAVWRWPQAFAAKTAAATADDQPCRIPVEKPSIAVLPFENLSGDPGQEYFSDGISEDIITALSYLHSFPVVSRSSSFSYKGQNISVDKLADELGVSYVLEGSVRRSGDHLRVSAQLTNALTNHHVWAMKYDRTLDDVFAIQDDITQRIALAVQPELTDAELAKVRVKPPDSLTAWDNYLRGMHALERETCDGNEEARRFFGQAIEIDDKYGLAWAGLAWGHCRDVYFQCHEDLALSRKRALETAQRGVELDDGAAFTHFVLSTAFVYNEDVSRGLRELERTLEINPFLARAHLALGNRLDLVGRSAEGIDKLRTALALNPREPERQLYMVRLARALIVEGQYEEALDWIEQAISLRPNTADLHYRLAVCLGHLDRVAEARAALEFCDHLQPGFIDRRRGWRPYPDEERNSRFFAGLLRHGLLQVR